MDLTTSDVSGASDVSRRHGTSGADLARTEPRPEPPVTGAPYPVPPDTADTSLSALCSSSSSRADLVPTSSRPRPDLVPTSSRPRPELRPSEDRSPNTETDPGFAPRLSLAPIGYVAHRARFTRPLVKIAIGICPWCTLI